MKYLVLLRHNLLALGSAIALMLGLSVFAQQDEGAGSAGSIQKSLMTREQLDSLIAVVLTPVPQSAEIEVFRTVERPAKGVETLEREFRQYWEQERQVRKMSDEEFEHLVKLNVEANTKLRSQPYLHRERFRYSGVSRQYDQVDSGVGGVITPATPFWSTSIQPGDPRLGDGQYFKFYHPNPTPAGTHPNWPVQQGTASRHRITANTIRDVREELIGLERPLLELLAVAVCELPKWPLTKEPKASDLNLDREKIEKVLSGEGSIRAEVQPEDSRGDRRLRISFSIPGGLGGFFSKGPAKFAEIVVSADDFRAVYEQRLFDGKGKETVVVTADGFDATVIPREKKWIRRTAEGEQEITSYVVLNAKTNIEIPAAEFEFHPPAGYLLVEIGPDGREIAKEADPLPVLEKKVRGSWLLNLNVLAVFVLAAFAVRQVWLRRQATVAR